MQFDILTIFPEILANFFSVGIIAQAIEKQQLAIHTHDLRQFTDDPHRMVDDRPYGGGPGMVMKVEPFVRGIESIAGKTPNEKQRIVLLSSQGKMFTQQHANRWSKLDTLILLCGRYEGIDERLLSFVDEEICIGDYVLSGGEAAAAVIIEATSRLVPGVVGKFESVEGDSFYQKSRLGPPQYTRPPEFRGLTVPEVLLSGDHAKVEEFREKRSWEKTLTNRPDLVGVDLDRKNDDG